MAAIVNSTVNASYNVNSTVNASYNSSASTYSDNFDADIYYDQKNRIRVVYFFCLALVLPLGVVCNLLCAIILCASRSLRNSTTAHYLVALAFADSLFLIGEILRWSSWTAHGQPITGYRLMHEYDVICKMTFFLRYSGKVISAWIIVIITGERFITIAFPLKVSTISTLPKARVVILLTLAAGFAVGSFPLWTVGKGVHKGKDICRILDGDSYELWNTAILRIGQLLLPSIIIFILTALIIIFLAKANNRRRCHLQPHNGTGVSLKRISVTKKVERQLTTMLLFVAIAFLLLRFPYTLTYYLDSHKKSLWPDMSDHQHYHLYLALKISDILATTNYAINFFLYCLSGSIFRQQVRTCFHCNGVNGRQGRPRARSFTLTSLMSSRRSSSITKI